MEEIYEGRGGEAELTFPAWRIQVSCDQLSRLTLITSDCQTQWERRRKIQKMWPLESPFPPDK